MTKKQKTFDILPLVGKPYIHPAGLVELGNSPIVPILPESVCKRILEAGQLKGVVSTYPVFKYNDRDHRYGINFGFKEVEYDLACFDYADGELVVNLQEVILPLLQEVKDLWDAVDSGTIEDADQYGYNHSFDDLYVERLLFDPETCTLKLELGS